jgi:hypothetical protein
LRAPADLFPSSGLKRFYQSPSNCSFRSSIGPMVG